MSWLTRLQAAFKTRVQRKRMRFTHAELTAAALTQALTFGDLPANAIVIGYIANVSVAFTDGAAATYVLDIGDGTTANVIANDVAMASTGKKVPTTGLWILPAQGTWTLTMVSSANVVNATAGDVTVDVFFVDATAFQGNY